MDSRNFIHRILVTVKYYTSPSALDDVLWVDALVLCADAPFVQKDAVVYTDLLREYVDGDYWLPENISLAVTEKIVRRK